MSKNNECVCAVLRKHAMKYIFKELEFEFRVQTKNSWDIHPISFPNPQKMFEVLAEGPRGPLIIEMGNEIIGVNFLIHSNYPSTLSILQNFINHHLERLSVNLNEPTISILRVKGGAGATFSLEEELYKALDIQEKKNDPFDSVFIKTAVKVSDSESVQKNTISRLFSANSRKFSTKTEVKTRPNSKSLHSKARPQSSKSRIYSGNISAKRNLNTSNQGEQSMGFNDSDVEYLYRSPNHWRASSPPLHLASNNQNPEEKKSSDSTRFNFFKKNKGEIRLMLHPKYSRNLVSKEKASSLWTPGKAGLQQDNSEYFGTLTELRNLNIIAGSGRKHPVIRVSGPYQTEEERLRDIDKEKASASIAKPFFTSSVTKFKGPQFSIAEVNKSNYNEGPYRPPSAHKFRDVQRGNWVSRKNFKLS